MGDMFKNAYFGKAYKTRNGRKIIYIHSSKDKITKTIYHKLLLENDGFLVRLYDSNGNNLSMNSKFDVVSEWTEDIDKEQLRIIEANSLAEDIENGIMEKDLSSLYPHHDQSWIQGYSIGFERGYYKAKEE